LETVQNELRAIDKLRKPSHKNIVHVIKHGELKYMSLYFVDMELCDLNLHKYINRIWTPEIETEMPYFTMTLTPRMRLAQLWSIIEDITEGLVFIHSLKEIHRDLKPRNGSLLLNCLVISFIFTTQ
jgi:serine/threonine protein kinase